MQSNNIDRVIELESQHRRKSFVVQTDQQRFQQVCLNYLSNAIKFTESGGKVIVLVQLLFGDDGLGKDDEFLDADLRSQIHGLYGTEFIKN